MKIEDYNKTQLNVSNVIERNIYHRDYFAHFFRWSHVLKLATRNMNILDLGCGSAELLEVFWRNRYKPKQYVGVDLRDQTLRKNCTTWDTRNINANFIALDLTSSDLTNLKPNEGYWDMITCLEVLEHIPKEKQQKLLNNIYKLADMDTIILISTPNFDKNRGAAKNHIINLQPCERTYTEMLEMLSQAKLNVFTEYGTFADLKAIEDNLDQASKIAFMKLKQYHDVNLLSAMFAPLIPANARNVLYVCQSDENGKI